MASQYYLSVHLIVFLAITLHAYAAFSLAVPPSVASRQASESNVWTQHDLIGQGPRQEHSVTALGSNVYVLGGVAYNNNNNLETLNRVEFYSIADDTWHVAAPMPGQYNHLNVAGVGENLYFLGALSGGLNWTAVGKSHVYHSSNDSWTDLTSTPPGTARGSCAVGVHQGLIYLAGGMTYLDVIEGGQDSVRSVTSYNTVTDTWTTDLPPLPDPRQHVGGAVVDSTFYVIGGRENGIEQYHNTTYALDLDEPSAGWRKLAPMPTARGGLTCSAVNTRIYCFGGEGNPDNAARIFAEVEVFDTVSGEWESLPPMPVPRHGTGSVAVDGRVWIPGGGLVTAAYPSGWFDSFEPFES